MIYINDKQQTQDIKKFLKPNPQPAQPKPGKGDDTPRKGNAGTPSNRHMAVRGGR